ncbi:MAG: hypothetical protein ACI9VR_005432, partial [Cognaticolwellia sp.]
MWSVCLIDGVWVREGPRRLPGLLERPETAVSSDSEVSRYALRFKVSQAVRRAAVGGAEKRHWGPFGEGGARPVDYRLCV